MSPAEARARTMTRAGRAAYLKAHGWHRLSARESQCWLAPGWHRDGRGRVSPGADRGFYTLAAAVRAALEWEAAAGGAR